MRPDGSAELVKARVATRERRARREQVARDHQRETLVGLQSVVVSYRKTLHQDRELELPTAQSQRALTEVRAAYQTMVHRVASPAARHAVDAVDAVDA